MSRQERRQRLKKLEKVIARLDQHGLSPAPELVELAALVAMIDGAMSADAPGSSARAVRRLAAVQDRTNANASFRTEVACRKGCVLCCSLHVSATAPQIFAIADHIRRTAPDFAAAVARIETADASTRGLDARGRFLNKAFCAFLVDNACSIYPVRPSACRGALSRSVDACERAYRGETGENNALIDAANLFRNACDEAFWAVLHTRGFRLEGYELAHAVLVALADEDAETRWHRGEDVFAPVASEPMAQVGQNDELFWQSLWNVAHGEPVPAGQYRERFPDWCR